MRKITFILFFLTVCVISLIAIKPDVKVREKEDTNTLLNKEIIQAYMVESKKQQRYRMDIEDKLMNKLYDFHFKSGRFR